MFYKNRLIEAILMRTGNIPFSIYKKKMGLNYPKICSYWIISKGLKDDFQNMVNEPSVLDPLKFDCSLNTFPTFHFSSCYLKVMIPQIKFSRTRKFTLRNQ